MATNATDKKLTSWPTCLPLTLSFTPNRPFFWEFVICPQTILVVFMKSLPLMNIDEDDKLLSSETFATNNAMPIMMQI